MTSNELRERYLHFFKERAHAVLPSAPLVPENDPTTLFTSSGMQPLVPYLLGQHHPQGTRLADSQKCFRTVDIDEIGDNRHLTFFEMLGNWSLGDYFKKEQIPWFFEFVTRVLGLDPKRLYATVFAGDPSIKVERDEESVEIWRQVFASVGIDAKAVDHPEAHGMGEGRIFYYPPAKNWWSRAGEPKDMPVGEIGGPDAELFWDFGEPLGLHESSRWKDQPCHVNCDCGRFVEIGNSVFMQYQRTEEGFTSLAQKNVDFGGGLERIMMAVADTPDIFAIDLFDPLRARLEPHSGKWYGEDTQETKAFRVIMDHLRAATMLVGDGVIPSNKDQGYFVRRLIRRAIRFAQTLGIQESLCVELARAVVTTYASVYPRLREYQDQIVSQLDEEEKKFRKTLSLGLQEFERMTRRLPSGESLSANEAFDLYQSYGFPIEMTVELADEKKIGVDREGFNQEFQKHQELSRAGAKEKFSGGLADHSVETTRLHTANHLMLEALKRVLGRGLNQKGSNITSERLRFDFNYPNKLTGEQIAEVERIVNEVVDQDLPVHYEAMTVERAKEIGATGVFDERYGERVKVYNIGHPGVYFSQEICGGPHVRHTAQVGHITITKEETVSSGVRRVKAIVSGGAELKPGE